MGLTLTAYKGGLSPHLHAPCPRRSKKGKLLSRVEFETNALLAMSIEATAALRAAPRPDVHAAVARGSALLAPDCDTAFALSVLPWPLGEHACAGAFEFELYLHRARGRTPG